MQVRFFGTRGSIATPGPATLRYGGNTSCVLVRSASGTLIVLDCGTGAVRLGPALSNLEPAPRHGHLLITHTHWDHIQGFPFFAPLFVPGKAWVVYGPRGVGASLRDTLAGQMQYVYFPVTLDDLGATVRYRDLVEGEFDVGDIHVTAQYLNHPTLTLGFRLEADGATIVYAPDHEPYSRQLALGERRPLGPQDEKHVRFLADADLVIHDAQYVAEEYPKRIGWGHSTVESAVDMALAAHARRLELFHHDPIRDDDAVDELVVLARRRVAEASSELEVFAAAEGVELDLMGSASDEPRSVGAPQALSAPVGLVDHAVLVAAEDPQLAEAVSDVVRADDLRLVTATTADEAVTLAQSARPSVIVLQGMLSGEGARQVCRMIRSENEGEANGVPVVLIDEDEDPARRTEDAKAGVTDWLTRPLSPAYLRTRVRAWVLRTACRWRPAPLPENESHRLRSLIACGILDTAAEERFDRYTRLASALFDVPIALVSLVDRDRQWFKSRHGLDVVESPRDTAFCAHAILGNQVMQVPDAQLDDRFADNPLVLGEPRVRFYAGAPLTLPDRSRVGTLCVIDHRARQLNDRELALLRDLADLVQHELAEMAALAAS